MIWRSSSLVIYKLNKKEISHFHRNPWLNDSTEVPRWDTHASVMAPLSSGWLEFHASFFFFYFYYFFFLANLAQLSSQSNENGAVERRESLVFLPFSFHVFSLSTVDQWLVFLWVFCLFFFSLFAFGPSCFPCRFCCFSKFNFLVFFRWHGLVCCCCLWRSCPESFLLLSIGLQVRNPLPPSISWSAPMEREREADGGNVEQRVDG